MNANMNMYIYISIHEPVIFQGVVNDFWILSTPRVESLNLRRIQAIRRWQSLASWSRFCKNANMINNWNSHVISSPKHHHFFWNKWNFIFLQNHGLRSQSSIFPVILSPMHLWSFLGNDIKLSRSSDHHKFNKVTKNDALETSKKLCFGNQKWKITKKTSHCFTNLPPVIFLVYLIKNSFCKSKTPVRWWSFISTNKCFVKYGIKLCQNISSIRVTSNIQKCAAWSLFRCSVHRSDLPFPVLMQLPSFRKTHPAFNKEILIVGI